MKTINWALFPSTPMHGLCVGEEKTLTQAEVTQANEILGRMFEDRAQLEAIFNGARARFGQPSNVQWETVGVLRGGMACSNNMTWGKKRKR